MIQPQLFSAEGPIAGVDEAGRGPLAGPVVAAAVILDSFPCACESSLEYTAVGTILV